MSSSMEEWEARERAVTLTNKQWSKLTSYLAMSSHGMEQSAESWARLSQKRDDGGNARFPNAAGNAEYLMELNASVEAIRKTINGTG